MKFEITNFFNEYFKTMHKLKPLLKNIYFRFFRFFGRIFFPVINSHTKLEDVGAEGLTSFKGYYDISPENENGLIFVYQCNNDSRSKAKNFKKITLAIYLSSNLKNPFRTKDTHAFNWQQGSRAYWLDDKRLIFNDYCAETDTYVAKIWNVPLDFVEKKIEFAVGSPLNKDSYLSINYKRLAALRPDYGYFAHSKIETLHLDYDEDGIWMVDIASGKGKLIYSLANIISSSKADFPEGTLHKLNHVMVSPDKKCCLVIHRYFLNNVRRGRLLMLSLEKNKIIEIPTGGIVSHYCWLDNNLAVGFMNDPEGKLKYFHIDTKSELLVDTDKLSLLKYGDGHPTHFDGRGFITDTYPDKWGIQRLIHICEDGKTECLAKFFHGIDYNGETRCDLHPVFCTNSRYLYFDSVFSGKRRLYRRKIIS